MAHIDLFVTRPFSLRACQRKRLFCLRRSAQVRGQFESRLKAAPTGSMWHAACGRRHSVWSVGAWRIDRGRSPLPRMACGMWSKTQRLERWRLADRSRLKAGPAGQLEAKSIVLEGERIFNANTANNLTGVQIFAPQAQALSAFGAYDNQRIPERQPVDDGTVYGLLDKAG